MPDFKTRYEVDDGYVGGSRPQSFRIREGDYYFPDNATDDRLLEIFYEALDEDMRQKISYHKVNESEFLEWARDQMKTQAA